ncbi:RRM domain-containing protein [Entamoeba marina]
MSVVVVDNEKLVKQESLVNILSYCGKIVKIDKKSCKEFAYFIVEYESTTQAESSLYLRNTMVDGSQIQVMLLDDFKTDHPQCFDENISAPGLDITYNDDAETPGESESTVSTKDKIKITTQATINKAQETFVDIVCGIRNSQAWDKIQTSLGVDTKPDYAISAEDYHREHTDFKPRKFVVDQKGSTTATNSTTKKTLPPVPPKKEIKETLTESKEVDDDDIIEIK